MVPDLSRAGGSSWHHFLAGEVVNSQVISLMAFSAASSLLRHT